MEKEIEKPQSNEEIIDELTKDLEGSCIRAPNVTNVNNNDSACSFVPQSDKDFDEEEKTDKELDKEARITELPIDFVDEELIKSRDEGLTETQKEEFKCKADELKNKGNVFFKDGEYVKAIVTYTEGIQTCPLSYTSQRSILYANRAAAKAKAQTEKESAISDCTKAVELNPNYVKAYIRRAQLYEETEKLDEALEDFKKVLTYDPAHTEANYAIRRLPPLIEERNNKLKEEMLGKLKDLGNLVLKPFGLSTNNFELQKDPNSGGYSVKFNQNPS